MGSEPSGELEGGRQMHKGTSIYWLLFVLMGAMVVWTMWQQSRQQKNRRQLQSSVGPGDRVVTVGGLIGTVQDVKDKELTLTISDGVSIRILRSAIGGKYQEGPSN